MRVVKNGYRGRLTAWKAINTATNENVDRVHQLLLVHRRISVSEIAA